MGTINLCRAWMCYSLPDIGRQTPQNPPAGLKRQDVANAGDVKHCVSYQREYRKPWKLKSYG